MNRLMSDMVLEFHGLGYDRYRIDGKPSGATCRLWKAGEHVSSIEFSAPVPYMAMIGALAKSKAWPSEIVEQPEDCCASAATLILEDETMTCFPGIPKIMGKWLEAEKVKLEAGTAGDA